jgi:hypothetical protein
VLHVDDDLAEVEQDPAALLLALAPDRLGAELAQPLLDGVHDREHLAVVGCGGEQEHVGDDELLAHVEQQDVLAELVGRGLGSRGRELDSAGGGRHDDQPSQP